MRIKIVYAEYYYTHLAVNWGRNGEIDKCHNYNREAGQARHRVNLSKEWIQTMKTQSKDYHYSPISSVDRDDVVG